jgi:hypothetical protein
VELGTGVAVSIGDLVEICRKITDSTARVAPDDGRVRPATSEVQVLLSDPRWSANAIGLRPTTTLCEPILAGNEAAHLAECISSGYVSSVNAVRYTGATPLLVDSERSHEHVTGLASDGKPLPRSSRSSTFLGSRPTWSRCRTFAIDTDLYRRRRGRSARCPYRRIGGRHHRRRRRLLIQRKQGDHLPAAAG